MGTWGTEILENDYSMDVHGEYISLLYNGIEKDEALNKLIDQFKVVTNEEEKFTNFWLAVALAQYETGRLSDEVKGIVIRIIDNNGYSCEEHKRGGLLRCMAPKTNYE